MKPISILAGLLFAAFIYPETSYRFIVLGDRAGGNRPGVFPAVIAQTLTLKEKVSFYINVGDLIQGYTADTSELKRQWADVMAELKPITSKTPMHFVPGNHDITDAVQLPLYLRFAGKPYYSFDVGPDHFVVLDNSRGNGILADPAKQLEWLKADLEKADKARWTFCFYHMPGWAVDPGEQILDTLHAIFRAGGVDYVINGHLHAYRYGVRDRIRYITLGSSGGAADPLNRTTGNAYQFMVADVGKDSVSLRPVLLSGDTLRLEWVDRYKLSLMDSRNAPSWTRDSKGNMALVLAAVNPHGSPLSARLFWEKRGSCAWRVSPETLSAEVPPQGKKDFKFIARNTGPEACPVLRLEYRWAGDSLLMTLTPAVQRAMTVARAAGKITPDGDFTEKAWAALLCGPENRFGAGDTASDSTWIGLAHDGENLYLAYLCWEKDIDSMPAATPADKRDSLSPREVQLRFYLGTKADEDSFYQVHFNIIGALQDMKVRIGRGGSMINDLAWDGVGAWKGKRLADRWQGEFVIPWKALGMKGPGEFRFNCRRNSNREIAYQEPYERQPRRFAGAILAR